MEIQLSNADLGAPDRIEGDAEAEAELFGAWVPESVSTG
jgi:hypothetical protein